MASDSGTISILIFIDLRATFDTINHSILFNHLESSLGVLGVALNGFKSCFADRSQFIALGGYRSEISSVLLVFLRAQF